MISLSNPSISLEDITNKVSEEEIFTHFFGQIDKLPCIVNSPLRKDNTPSFSIYYGKTGNLCFHDFGTNETWNIYSLLEKYLNCDFKTLLNIIWKKMQLKSIPNKKLTKTITKKLYINHNLEINVAIREFQDYDLQFWEEFGISKEWLQFGQIYAISNIFLKKENKNEIVIPAEKYAYAYAEFKDNTTTFKIYQPFSKKFKWMNNHNNSIWDLWYQLPESNQKLIITSSRKDALCLWANLGIPSTCLQGEGYFPKKHVIDQLKERFNNIYILLDNDTTGVKFGKELANTYDLIYCQIDNNFQVKDPSDFFKRYGKDKFINYFNNLIQ